MDLNKRLYIYRGGHAGNGPVVYWMSRDQRVADNYALVYAQKKANEKEAGLIVVFCLAGEFLGASAWHYDFMINGLKETSKELMKLNIPLHIIYGSPEEIIPGFIIKNDISLLITDFDPLKIKKNWKVKILERIGIPFHEVDTHNIVPCRLASPKQEWAAYTIRPKIKKLLEEFLSEPESPVYYRYNSPEFISKYHTGIIEEGKHNTVIPPKASWVKPGEEEAQKLLKSFIDEKLSIYADKRNDPLANAVSNLSPCLHFGMLSPQRAAYEVNRSIENEASKAAFLEELIIRRELADNFCFYNDNYDNFEGIADWAKLTLNLHRPDLREHIYTINQFETAQTHDPLWNAAQTEMIDTGKMHGYMRMYWAKKILEWTESPEAAFDTAIYLNDKYSLDGRDPNGYTGIAWSIGGVHDRPWPERKVFGKIRYMSFNGMKSKFDVNKYIAENKPYPGLL